MQPGTPRTPGLGTPQASLPHRTGQMASQQLTPECWGGLAYLECRSPGCTGPWSTPDSASQAPEYPSHPRHHCLGRPRTPRHSRHRTLGHHRTLPPSSPITQLSPVLPALAAPISQFSPVAAVPGFILSPSFPCQLCSVCNSPNSEHQLSPVSLPQFPAPAVSHSPTPQCQSPQCSAALPVSPVPSTGDSQCSQLPASLEQDAGCPPSLEVLPRLSNS